MSQRQSEVLANVTCCQELTVVKNWLVDGSLSIDGISAEYAIQPPDEIQIPALSEHVIMLAHNADESQFARFAGNAFHGYRPKNTFCIVPRGIPSEFAWSSQDECLMFGFTQESISQVAEQTECANPSKVELRPLLFTLDENIVHYAYCLLHEIRTGGLGGKLYRESLLACFRIHLLRHYCTFEAKLKDQSGGLAPYKLKEILDYIDSHLTDKDLSLNTMADMTALSSYYFARQFKQSTGFAPHQYVIHQRIDKAKRLLKQRQLSISQVAFECGFSNQSHFGKSFRKATGTTPKRYREQL